jgi:hypothetical protein
MQRSRWADSRDPRGAAYDGVMLMMDRRFLIAGIGAAGFLTADLAVLSASTAFAAPNAIAAFDKDHDGTLDLDEVKAAADSLFDKLDKDKDGTLDKKEIGGRLTKSEFKAADTDNDGTLTKDEYFALVEDRFKAADADNEGTLDAKELRSKAGRALLRLIQ